MKRLEALQRDFLAQLEGDGECAPGIATYRSSVRHGRRDALAAAYPRVLASLGEATFAALADAYAAAHPPACGDLHEFGAGFGAFLAPAHGPGLADLAAREWAAHRAFHAPDAPALDFAALARVDAADQGRLRLRMHPSVAWSEGWLVWRDGDLEVREAALEPPERMLLAALAAGRPLAEALDCAGAPHAPRIAAALARFAADGLFIAFEVA